MQRAMMTESARADAVIMAAAVADYTPQGGAASGKIEKQERPLTVTLERTPDILAELGRGAGRRGCPRAGRLRRRDRRSRARARQKLAAKQRRPDRRQRRVASPIPASTSRRMQPS